MRNSTRTTVLSVVVSVYLLLLVAVRAQVPTTTYVKIGGDAKAAMARGGTVLLERGGSYAGPLVPRAGMTIGSFGDAAKPRPLVTAAGVSDNGITIYNVGGVTVRDVDVRYIGPAGRSLGRGIQILNSSDDQLLDLSARGFRMGITVEALAGRRNARIQIRGDVIEDNVSPAGSDQHSAGLFMSLTDGAVVIGNVFNRNGTTNDWHKGIYNHDAYLHGSNGPVEVRDNVFASGASHGLQQRSGGACTGNVFWADPIGQSYGMVNGEMVFPGGVRGEVAWNVYLGSSRLVDQQRGWAIDLANLGDVSVHDLLFEGDALSFGAAVNLKPGTGVTNPGQELKPAQWKVQLARLYLDWTGGDVRDVRGAVPVGVMLRCPAGRRGDARIAVGGDHFVDAAKMDPRNAARVAVSAAFKARGLAGPNPAPTSQPTPTPTTVPTTQPQAKLPKVAALRLYDATLDKPVRDLVLSGGGDTIDLKSLSGRSFTVVAVTEGAVGSIRFRYAGIDRTETSPPLALAGDVGGDLTGVTPTLGTKDLVVDAFAGTGGTGALLGTVKVAVTVVDGATTEATVKARLAEIGARLTAIASEGKALEAERAAIGASIGAN